MPYFLVAAGNGQPQVTGNCAKLRTDNSREILMWILLIQGLRCNWNFLIM